MTTTNDLSSPNKQALYGHYLSGQAWRQKLQKKATHMALDIPEDDVNINVTKGMGWKELAIAGAMAGAGLAAGMYFGNGGDSTPAASAPPPAAAVKAEPVRGSIRFWVDDAGGKTKLGEQKVE